MYPAALNARERQERFDRWYRHRCDKTYWTAGPCCAGCDHWRSDMADKGQCTAGPILSGHDVQLSLGIVVSTLRFKPGHPYTRSDYQCGLFRDDFNWLSLEPDYLNSIGATDEEGRLKKQPTRNGGPDA